jgi:hypothetical protein
MSNEKKIKLINPKREPLTSEKLRELSGLDLSDEQAEEVICSLTRYARMIFDFIIRQEQATERESEASSTQVGKHQTHK